MVWLRTKEYIFGITDWENISFQHVSLPGIILDIYVLFIACLPCDNNVSSKKVKAFLLAVSSPLRTMPGT